ncbi:aldehyde dehydrogenase family protein [Streptomyces xanthophaeus]|uniref:aldehyde dehydrogenase family protein n=1 Tax=Streptomyces xanthophaeus TaxID=67385 RepID=UPI003F4CF2F2
MRLWEIGRLALADGSFERTSLLAALRNHARVPGSGQYDYEAWEGLRVAEGSARVALRMAADLGGRVRTGAPVEAVTVRPTGGCSVRLAGGETLTADAVVSALPVGPLRALAVTGVSEERLPSLHHQRQALAAKFVAAYDRPFWRGLGRSGLSECEGVLGSTWPQSDGVPSALVPPERFGVLLGTPAHLRARALLDDVARLYGGEAHRPLATYVRMWGTDPWTQGYVTQWTPGDVTAVGPLHGTHEPPFYVCGSDQWVAGYTEGAVRTGRDAAGEVLRQFRDEELPAIVDSVRFYAGAARNLSCAAAGEYTEGRTSLLRREPVGVCAQITPWNYPLMMAVWKIAPAIAAGSTTVLKPADTTPSSAVLLARITAPHLPPGVLNVVCGDRGTGRALTVHRDVALISVTGSVRAGREIAAAAAADLKRVHLELGGNAPVLVHDDVDVAATAAALAAVAYYNAGQDCTAPTRFLVHHRVHDAFLAAFAAETGKLRTGARTSRTPTSGPSTVPRSSRRSRACSTGCRTTRRSSPVVPASAGPASSTSPPSSRGVLQEDEIVQEEIFGPVVTVQSFSDEAKALHLANDVRYGLAARRWTADHDRAMRATRALHTGIVWVNTHGTTVSEMPHGGVKHSGYGSDLSLAGLLDYTQVKHVML